MESLHKLRSENNVAIGRVTSCPLSTRPRSSGFRFVWHFRRVHRATEVGLATDEGQIYARTKRRRDRVGAADSIIWDTLRDLETQIQNFQ